MSTLRRHRQPGARAGRGRSVPGLAALAPILILLIRCGSGEAPGGDPLSPSAALAGHEQGMVVFLSGEAFLRREGAWDELDIGDPVERGDIVKVLADSFCDLQFGETALVRVQQNTLLEIERLFTAPGETEIASELLTGRILVKVRRLMGNEEFRVGSQGAVLGVRGTEFLVRNSGAETLVAVRKGAVGVTPPGGSEILITARREIVLPGTGGKGPPAPRGLAPEREEEMQQLDAVPFPAITRTGHAGFGTIRVTTSPQDASIFAEGFPVGTGGFFGILPVGTRLALSVRKNGYREETLTASVPSEGDHRYDVTLEHGGRETLAAERGPNLEAQIRDLSVHVERLREERNDLREKEAFLAGDRDRLVSDRDRLMTERERIEEQRAALQRERDGLAGREQELLRQLAMARQKVLEVIDLRKKEQEATDRLIEGLRQGRNLPVAPQPTSAP